MRPGLDGSVNVDHIMMPSPKQISPLTPFKSVLKYQPFALESKTERPYHPTSGEYIVAHTMELSPLMVRGPKGAIWDRRHYQNQDERGGVFTSTRAN